MRNETNRGPPWEWEPLSNEEKAELLAAYLEGRLRPPLACDDSFWVMAWGQGTLPITTVREALTVLRAPDIGAAWRALMDTYKP